MGEVGQWEWIGVGLVRDTEGGGHRTFSLSYWSYNI